LPAAVCWSSRLSQRDVCCCAEQNESLWPHKGQLSTRLTHTNTHTNTQTHKHAHKHTQHKQYAHANMYTHHTRMHTQPSARTRARTRSHMHVSTQHGAYTNPQTNKHTHTRNVRTTEVNVSNVDRIKACRSANKTRHPKARRAETWKEWRMPRQRQALSLLVLLTRFRYCSPTAHNTRRRTRSSRSRIS
jgi:hypothetical protein